MICPPALICLFQIVTESVENIRTVQALGRERYFHQQFVDGLQTPHKEIVYQARIQVESDRKVQVMFIGQAAMYGSVNLALPFFSTAAQCILGGYLVTTGYLVPNTVYT